MALFGLIAPWRPAVAQDEDSFSATVKVDATAESAAAAREIARHDGQRRALIQILGRLAGDPDSPKLAKLDEKALPDKAISAMVVSFEVANERMSAVRYLADYTFHFRPGEVKRVLRSVGLAVAAESGGNATASPATKEGGDKQGAAATPGDAAKPVVVLPVWRSGGKTTLWEDPNPWREAWAQRPAATGALQLIVPLGDVGDLATIDAEQARSGNSEALASIARDNGADDAVVATATARRQGDRLQGVDLSIRRFHSGQLAEAKSRTLDANPGESPADFLRRAADAVASDLDSGAKKPAAGYDQQGSLTAIVPITSLDDWIRVRDRLGAIAGVRKVGLMSLARDQATVEIQYSGSVDQLKSAFTEAGFDLVRGDTLWRLARSGEAGPR
ncbi:MAG: DUF2066 domain-containing protein [Alphaproteobacteria bacterium]|nr:DUF2066 domain-containing protein [Alphaproteobacteria bacterium]